MRVEKPGKTRQTSLLLDETDTSYLSHPDILIRKPIRSSKNLRINPKFRSGGILEKFVFRSGQNYAKKLYQEMIQRLQLLIRNEISLIRGKYWSSG